MGIVFLLNQRATVTSRAKVCISGGMGVQKEAGTTDWKSPEFRKGLTHSSGTVLLRGEKFSFKPQVCAGKKRLRTCPETMLAMDVRPSMLSLTSSGTCGEEFDGCKVTSVSFFGLPVAPGH